eukprot:c28253_g1_i2 orf=325-2145(+)
MISTMNLILVALQLSFLHLLLVSAEDDVFCLQQFKVSVSDPSGYLDNWVFGNSSNGFICNFVGVTCWHVGENKVFSLALPAAGLTGRFPHGLSNCSSIQQLDLSDNLIEGSIPSDICEQMPYLTTLDLSQNNLNGTIPVNLSDCLYLNKLYLRQNKLHGTIPGQIGTLSRLMDFDLSANNLSGPIPSDLSKFANAFGSNPLLCGPPLTKSCSSSSSSRPNTGLIVGVAIGVILVTILFIGFCVWWVLPTRKARAALRDEHKWAKLIKAPKSITVSMFEKPLVKMKLSDLMVATDDFSKDSIIGTGRTGTVYRATLADGSILAIKRLHLSTRSDKQFRAEMNTLGQLRHRNLVPLLGYCVAEGERLLVYKHMTNGSLRDCLHNAPEDAKLDWITRLKIAIGAARGLAWLHHSCNPRIIHRNISAMTILLDEEYEPRITDFGLARLMNPVDTHISTYVNGDFGDVGYVTPEYIRTLVATTKGDVYSFGVVLLELITSQKANDVYSVEDFKGNLAEWVTYLSNTGQLYEAIDMSLKGKGVDDELMQFLRLARACVLAEAKERPTMYEVHHLLRSVGQRYDFTDQNEDEIPLTDTADSQYMAELIVAREN